MTIVVSRRKQQSGRVLILVLVILGVLTIFWVVALTSTGSELLAVGGRKSATQQLFYAEAGVASVIDTLTAYTPTGTDPVNGTVKDGVKDVAQVTVLQIQNDEDHARDNNLPRQDFEFDPPEGSGSGVNTAVARRYAVTAEAGGKIVQVGVYRVVPK